MRFVITDLQDQAGKLVMPKERKRVTFPVETFDVKKPAWTSMEYLEIWLETEKFSSGGFSDAFKGVTLSSNNEQPHTWVKTYNPGQHHNSNSRYNTYN